MNELIKMDSVARRIFWVRNMQVMLDSDLAELYEVETKNLNRTVSRNMARFPEKFRFQLTKEEFENLRFRNGTSNVVPQNAPRSEPQHGGRRYLLYVFTEQGVAMLSDSGWNGGLSHWCLAQGSRKKWFAFSKIEKDALKVVEQLKK